MTNAVFVEGVSGIGKSTTVRKLRDALRSSGHRAECFTEGDPNHPLDLCWVASLDAPDYEKLLEAYPSFSDALARNVVYRGNYVLLRYQIGQTPLFPGELDGTLRAREFCYNPGRDVVPLRRFTEVFVRMWEHFAQGEGAKYDYAVFDASLVTHMTNDLIRNYGASDEELVGHLEELLRAIRGLNPVIFYLSSDDVRERLIRARKSRGQTHPDDAKIAYWEGRKRKDLSILPRLSAMSRIIRIENDDWDSVIPAILSEIVT